MEKKWLLYDILKDPKFYDEQFGKKLKELPHIDIPLSELETDSVKKEDKQSYDELMNAKNKLERYLRNNPPPSTGYTPVEDLSYIPGVIDTYILRKEEITSLAAIPGTKIAFNSSTYNLLKKDVKQNDREKIIIDTINKINTGNGILDYKKYQIDFPQIVIKYEKFDKTIPIIDDYVKTQFINTVNEIIRKINVKIADPKYVSMPFYLIGKIAHDRIESSPGTNFMLIGNTTNNKQSTKFTQSQPSYFQWIDYIKLQLSTKSAFYTDTIKKLSQEFFGITSNEETKQDFKNAQEEIFGVDEKFNTNSNKNNRKNNTLNEDQKQKLALRGQALHKRRMINDYIVPIAYLIYSFIFIKYYYFQKRRAVKVVGDITFKMYEFMFDYKNPIIKKINVYIYKNIKDSLTKTSNNTGVDHDVELLQKLKDYKTACITHFDKMKITIAEQENLDLNFNVYKNVTDLLKNVISDMHKIIMKFVEIYKILFDLSPTTVNSSELFNIINKIEYIDFNGFKNTFNLTKNATMKKDLIERLLKYDLENYLKQLTYGPTPPPPPISISSPVFKDEKDDETFINKLNKLSDVDYKTKFKLYKDQYKLAFDTYQNILKTIQKINIEKIALQSTDTYENEYDQLLLEEKNINLTTIFKIYKYYKLEYDKVNENKKKEKVKNALIDYIKKNIGNQIEIYDDLFNYLNNDGKTDSKIVKKPKMDKFYNEISNITAKINFSIIYILRKFNIITEVEVKNNTDEFNNNPNNYIKLNFKNKSTPKKPFVVNSDTIITKLEILKTDNITPPTLKIINFIQNVFQKQTPFYENMDNSFEHLIGYLYISFSINKYTENFYFGLILNQQEQDKIVLNKKFADKIIEDIKFQFVNKVRDYKKKNKVKTEILLLNLDKKLKTITYENDSVLANINAKNKEYKTEIEAAELVKAQAKKTTADSQYEKAYGEYTIKQNNKIKMERFYKNLTIDGGSVVTKDKLKKFFEDITSFVISMFGSPTDPAKSSTPIMSTDNTYSTINDISIPSTGSSSTVTPGFSNKSYDDLINFIVRTGDPNKITNDINYRLLDRFLTFINKKPTKKYNEINEKFLIFITDSNYPELKKLFLDGSKISNSNFTNKGYFNVRIEEMKNFFNGEESSALVFKDQSDTTKKTEQDNLLEIQRNIDKKEEKKKLFESKRVNIPLVKKKIEDEIDKYKKLNRTNGANNQVESFKTDFISFFNDMIAVTKFTLDKIDKKSFSKDKNQLYFLYKKDGLYIDNLFTYIQIFSDKNEFISYWVTEKSKNEFLQKANLYFSRKGEFIVQIKNNYNLKDDVIMPFFEQYEIQYDNIIAKIKIFLDKINKGTMILGKNNIERVDIFINQIIYEKKTKLFKLQDDIKTKQTLYNYNTQNTRGSTKVVLPYTDVMLMYFTNLLIIYDYFAFFYE